MTKRFWLIGLLALALAALLSANASLAVLSGFIELDEITDPANPAADKYRLYVNDVGGTTKLMGRDSAGVETEFGSGGGSAGHWVSISFGGFTSTSGSPVARPGGCYSEEGAGTSGFMPEARWVFDDEDVTDVDEVRCAFQAPIGTSASHNPQISFSAGGNAGTGVLTFDVSLGCTAAQSVASATWGTATSISSNLAGGSDRNTFTGTVTRPSNWGTDGFCVVSFDRDISDGMTANGLLYSPGTLLIWVTGVTP